MVATSTWENITNAAPATQSFLKVEFRITGGLPSVPRELNSVATRSRKLISVHLWAGIEMITLQFVLKLK
jgi:hypothetical protein